MLKVRLRFFQTTVVYQWNSDDLRRLDALGGQPGGQNNPRRQGENSGGGDPGRPNGGSNGDYEANTWWLDVLSPTDEEMKILSKVAASFAGIKCYTQLLFFFFFSFFFGCRCFPFIP